MYESFYRLKTNPFRLIPDARFFYASGVHKHAMAYMRYGLLQGEGFIVITGDPGTGKSMLVQTLYSELKGHSVVAANMTSTNLDPEEALRSVANCFNVKGENKSKASLLLAIQDYLKNQSRLGKSVVLIVDEAQNLPIKSLEELRMLSNIQEGDKALLQIILLGQQGLADSLAAPALEQLSQRVIASCRLLPLDPDETRAYIEHRLRCAGWRGNPSFTGDALGIAYLASRGVPRLINIFCDRLLLAASLDERRGIDETFARQVLDELSAEAAGGFRQVSVEGRMVPEMESLIDASVNDTGSTPGDFPQQIPAEQRQEQTETAEEERHESVEAVPCASSDSSSSEEDFEPHASLIASQSAAHTGESVNAVVTQDVPPISRVRVQSDVGEKQPAPIHSGVQKSEERKEVERSTESVAQPTTIKQESRVKSLLQTVAMIFVIWFIFVSDWLDEPYYESASQIAGSDKKVASSTEDDFSSTIQIQNVVTDESMIQENNVLPDQEVIPDQEQISEQDSIQEQIPLPMPTEAPVQNLPESAAEPVDKNISNVVMEQDPAQGEIPLSMSKVTPERPLSKPASIPADKLNTRQTRQLLIPEVELKDMVFNLIFFYGIGEVEDFVSLFASDANVDGVKGQAAIKKHFSEYFQSTSMRRLSLGRMEWHQEADAAVGSGLYSIEAADINAEEVPPRQGAITLEVISRNGEPKISRLELH